MKSFVLTCFALMTLAASALGFESTIVRGTVKSTDQEPLPFANILLLQVTDSSFVQGAITNDNGEFALTYNGNGIGDLILRIQFVGYREFYSEPFATGKEVNLGTIVLQTDTEFLAEVTVEGRRPPFEHKIDRTVVNVQNSVTSVGNTALNVLSKSPSVVVDRATDRITLMGNQGVIVMIDNKPVRMEGRDVMDLLDGMSADNIDNIELITTPPASYDVQGNAGIININTIKNQTEGFTGKLNTSIGYGVKGKYGASLNLNYSKKRVYTYGNFSMNNDHTHEETSLFYDFLYDNDHVVSDMLLIRKPFTGMYTGEMGFDYDVSHKTTLGVTFQGQYRDWRMDAITTTDITKNYINTLQTVTSYERNQLIRLLGNFHIRHNFSLTSSLILDYDYITFNRDNPSQYNTVSKQENGTEEHGNFISTGETPLDIHVVKADYLHTFSDAIKFETGIKASLSAFENRVAVKNLMDDQYVIDEYYTDNFVMDEKVYAAYASLDWQLQENLRIKSGLRYEYYDLQLHSDKQQSILSREQGNLFPTVHLTYSLSKEKSLNLSYAKRLDRPGFLTLAPAFYFFDRNTLFTGNPGVVPTSSTQYKADMQIKGLTMSLQYTDSKLPIYDMQPELDEASQLFIVKPIQGATEKAFSFSISMPWQITEYWTSQYNFNSFLREQQPIIEGNILTETALFFTLTTTHNFNIGKGIDLELAGIYNGPFKYATMKIDARPSLDLGVRKKFTSGTSISLNVTDVFNSSSRWRMASDIPDTNMKFDWLADLEGPIFRFSVSLPLGNRQLKVRDKISTGSVEEQRRLN